LKNIYSIDEHKRNKNKHKNKNSKTNIKIKIPKQAAKITILKKITTKKQPQTNQSNKIRKFKK